MAPRSLENITDELSSQSNEPDSIDDLIVRRNGGTLALSVAGFVGGIAARVHYQRTVPKIFKSFFVIPFLSASVCGILGYKYSSYEYNVEHASALKNER